MRNKALGIVVVPQKEEASVDAIVVSCAAFLDEVRQLSRPKTYQQYSVALRYLREWCPDKQVGEIGGGDLLSFLTFLREEKRLSNRTAWTKLNVVVRWLKANGLTSF